MRRNLSGSQWCCYETRNGDYSHNQQWQHEQAEKNRGQEFFPLKAPLEPGYLLQHPTQPGERSEAAEPLLQGINARFPSPPDQKHPQSATHQKRQECQEQHAWMQL